MSLSDKGPQRTSGSMPSELSAEAWMWCRARGSHGPAGDARHAVPLQRICPSATPVPPEREKIWSTAIKARHAERPPGCGGPRPASANDTSAPAFHDLVDTVRRWQAFLARA